jgi:hypothetical protein
LIREVTGYAPYERRCMEMLRVGKDKKALKFVKKRVSIFYIFWHKKTLKWNSFNLNAE